MSSEGSALREYLSSVTGFSVPEDRWRVIAPGLLARVALRGFGNEDSYVRYLKEDTFGKHELEEVLSIFTVRKTNFFRNPATFGALARDVLPPLVERSRGGAPLAVWSAGCSTGEEPYSIAMTVRSLAQSAPRPSYILATDIVTGALNRARRGVYPREALDEIPEPYRHLLSVEEGRIEIGEAVRSMVEFHAHNLVRDAFPRPASGYWDAIFCRNVLIYFGADVARTVLHRFHDILDVGGALFLGHAEVLWGLEDRFDVVFSGETFFYRKRMRPMSDETKKFLRPAKGFAMPVSPQVQVGTKTVRIEPRPSSPTPALASSRPRGPSPTPAAGTPRPPRQATPGATLRPPAPPAFRPMPPPPPPDVLTRKLDSNTPTRPIPSLPFDLLARAEKSVADGDSEGAARALRAATQRSPGWAPPRLLLGRIYADRGETDLALAELEIAARAEPLEPRVHMLLGAVREKRNERELAEDAYRRAVYLEPDFVAARYALAQIYRNTGRTDRARRELRNVIKTLTTKSASEASRFTDGFSPAALAEMCERELKALGPG